MSFGQYLDSTMDIMEETRFKKKHCALFKKLAKELNFTYTEIESIMLIYYKVQKDGPEKHRGMTRDQLRELFHCSLDMTDEDLVSYTVMSLVRGMNPIVPMETWARIMSLYLRGSFEDKIKYCFNCYDLMNTHMLGRDVMLRLLSNAIIGQGSEDESEDAIKDLIELLVKKMDWDRDGRICLADFEKSCKEEPLLLEYLGPCLPSRIAVQTFLTTFTSNLGKL